MTQRTRDYYARRMRQPMDVRAYAKRSQHGPCFVCAFLAGDPEYAHELLFDDGEHVAFLSRYPTLPGYAIVVPRRHVEDVVRDLTAEEYLALQAVVHTVARAVSEVTRAERIYLLSLGSMQGNAHVHWHVAPLPPGVPYEQQQFHALMFEHGIVTQTADEVSRLGRQMRAALGQDGSRPR
jgi:diadenosine tetraphosphate (Ap4A) HIT family hydrolase